MSKQHGMLFADRLMPPLLDGRKTQTRRPVKPQPEHGCGLCHWTPTGWAKLDSDGACRCKAVRGYHVGDLIWARECWAEIGDEDEAVPREFVYRADGGDYSDWESVDGDKFRWYPSIHMPRRACRCWLEITDVRVQRIQDISPMDVLSEGTEIPVSPDGGLIAIVSGKNPPCNYWPVKTYDELKARPDFVDQWYRSHFAASWDSIYPGTWEENIWVWALAFKRVEAPQ